MLSIQQHELSFVLLFGSMKCVTGTLSTLKSTKGKNHPTATKAKCATGKLSLTVETSIECINNEKCSTFQAVCSKIIYFLPALQARAFPAQQANIVHLTILLATHPSGCMHATNRSSTHIYSEWRDLPETASACSRGSCYLDVPLWQFLGLLTQ